MTAYRCWKVTGCIALGLDVNGLRYRLAGRFRTSLAISSVVRKRLECADGWAIISRWGSALHDAGLESVFSGEVVARSAL